MRLVQLLGHSLLFLGAAQRSIYFRSFHYSKFFLRCKVYWFMMSVLHLSHVRSRYIRHMIFHINILVMA